jgi:large subunit ribosomal protein L2
MKQLKEIKKKNSGRNSSGRVVVRHQGGQQKRYYRTIDFRRDKIGISGKVVAIEYDPNRTVDIALVHYSDGEKRYMLAPQGLAIGAVVIAGKEGEVALGNALPMNVIPVGTIIHNIELTPGKGGQMARSAGTAATLQAKEGNFVHLRLPSGEVRRVPSHGMATVGQLGNIDKKNEKVGKAGRNRHRGIRPTVRGTAQNPRSHPHGGGEARSGVGLKSPKTYAGKIAVGKRRRPNKYSDKYIVSRRKGKKRG